MKTTKELVTVSLQQLDKVKGGFVPLDDGMIPDELKKKLQHVRT